MATQAEPIRLRRRLPPPSAIGGVLFLIFVVVGVGTGIKQGVCPNNATAWVGLTVTGLRLGMIYAMIALGYTMVYGILQLLNFAHSEIFMIGSFAGLYTLSKVFGITAKGHPNGVGGADLVLVLGVALIFAALASAIAAVLTERFAYRPLRRRGGTRLGYLITAIGVSLFLQNLFLLMDGGKHLGLPFKWPNIAGPGPVSYPQVLKRNTVFTIAGNPIDSLTLLIFVVALLMLVLLDRFVSKSRTGKQIRAVAEDAQTASMMGVDVNRIIVVTFFVGGLMAGAAGLFYGMYFTQAQFNMGFIPGIKAFTAAVLGGIGNIRGAMLGGIVLGLVENLGVACVGTQWQSVIAFLVLVAVLLFRPTGLLGERVGGSR